MRNVYGNTTPLLFKHVNLYSTYRVTSLPVFYSAVNQDSRGILPFLLRGCYLKRINNKKTHCFAFTMPFCRYKRAKEPENTKTPWAVKIVICILVLLVVALAVAIIIITVNNSKNPERLSSCSTTSSLKANLTSQDLYRDLSEQELRQVRDYILNVTSLNVTAYEKATLNSNYIFLIELQNPIKEDAIAYLDNNGPKPTRTANVIIFKGAASPPVVEEILVHFDKPMRHELNTFLTERAIPFHARPVSKQGVDILVKILKDFGKKADQILSDLFDGYTITNCSDQCLTYRFYGPSAMPKPSKEVMTYIWLTRNVPGMVVQPVGLELLIQGEGHDGSQWKTRVRYYSTGTY